MHSYFSRVRLHFISYIHICRSEIYEYVYYKCHIHCKIKLYVIVDELATLSTWSQATLFIVKIIITDHVDDNYRIFAEAFGFFIEIWFI